jgi:hypothetical protein
MTATGLAIMIASVGGVAVSCGYCIFRILRLPPKTAAEHVKSRLEIEAEPPDGDD